jgi:protein-S-isoprenylcysteine O-methyltransferase Ste14
MTSFDWIRILLFLVISAAIVRFSWRSLRDFRSYRFYRFFAFEILVVMVLLNLPSWFKSPFSLPQVISWVLLLGSAALAIHGFFLLRKMGRPSGPIEATTKLIRTGAYRYIRHPLYASLLYFGWGVFFKSPSWQNAVLIGLASMALFMTSRCEERENIERFGAEYKDMMASTRRFVPFIF